MYDARITRLNPTAFIFLIDRSGSMEEKMRFGSQPMTKADAVARVTNMMIRELVSRCRREDRVLDYFDIAAIGYSQGEAAMLLDGPEDFVKTSRLAMMPCRNRSFTFERTLPDGTTSITTDQLKYWIEPHAAGNTPMRSALEKALLLADRWCKRPANAASYPPTIFNITDGEASDGDHELLTDIARQIKSLRTDNGNVLFININIAAGPETRGVVFPSSPDDLPAGRHTRTLYDMSSEMPAEYNEAIAAITDRRPPFRGMGFNSSVADIFAMLNIGSRSISNMQ